MLSCPCLLYTSRPDGIYIESQDVIEDIFWSREALRKCFENKYKNKFVYAQALTRGTGSNEEYLLLHLETQCKMGIRDRYYTVWRIASMDIVKVFGTNLKKYRTAMRCV